MAGEWPKSTRPEDNETWEEKKNYVLCRISPEELIREGEHRKAKAIRVKKRVDARMKEKGITRCTHKSQWMCSNCWTVDGIEVIEAMQDELIFRHCEDS
jgi:hypothetical protein